MRGCFRCLTHTCEFEQQALFARCVRCTKRKRACCSQGWTGLEIWEALHACPEVLMLMVAIMVMIVM